MGRAFGLSFGSQAMAQAPPALLRKALMSASDFSEEPSLMRLTRESFGRPIDPTKASPPETTAFQ